MTDSPAPGPRCLGVGFPDVQNPSPVGAPILVPVPSRPSAWGVRFGLAASGLTLASQGLALVQGPPAIRSAVDALTSAWPGAWSGPDSTLVDAAVAVGYHSLQVRAALSAGLAVAAAVPLLLALRSGVLPRIAAVALMALNGMILTICVLDVFPQPARVVGVVAIGLQPVAAALLFAPTAGGRRRTHLVPARHVGTPLIPVLRAGGGPA